MLDTPEYRALHADTRLDDTAAAIAAGHFAEQFAKLKKEDTKEPRGRVPPAVPATATSAERDGGAAGGGQGRGRGRQGGGRTARRGGRAGAGAGAAGAQRPAGRSPRCSSGCANDPALRRICELAGRFRRVAQSKQRLKVAHGLDDVVGVEPGGDVGRLLPVGTGRSSRCPELELDTLRRIVERQALCREHHAVEPVGQGADPVVVVDGGTMAGTDTSLGEIERMLELRRVPLFERLDPEDLQRVAAVADERDFASGTTIVTEGEVGDELFVILEGLVRVERHEADGSTRQIRTYEQGDHFGELAVLLERPRVASVVARTVTSRTLVIGGEGLTRRS